MNRDFSLILRYSGGFSSSSLLTVEVCLNALYCLLFFFFSLCLVGEKLEERNRRKYEKGKENVERVMFYLFTLFLFYFICFWYVWGKLEQPV